MSVSCDHCGRQVDPADTAPEWDDANICALCAKSLRRENPEVTSTTRGGIGVKIRVNFETSVPDGIDPEDIEEWLRYRLGENGRMQCRNPLADTDLEAEHFTVDWRPVR